MKKTAKIFVLTASVMMLLSAFVSPTATALDKEIQESAAQVGGIYLITATENAKESAQEVHKKEVQQPQDVEQVTQPDEQRSLITRFIHYIKSFIWRS